MTIDQLMVELRGLKSADKLRIIQALANDLTTEDNVTKEKTVIEYQELRGIFTWFIGDEPAEVSMRRIRDDDWN